MAQRDNTTTLDRPGLVARVWSTAWSVIAGVVIAAGLLMAAHELTAIEIACVLIVTILVGDSCALSYSASRRLSTRTILLAGPGLAVLVLVLVGLAGLAGWVGFCAAVVVAVGSPWVWGPMRAWWSDRRGVDEPPSSPAQDEVRTVARRAARPKKPAPTQAPAEPPAPLEWEPGMLTVPDHLDAADLCYAWRSSYVALQRARTPAERARIVAVRQACLDAFEHEQPREFAAWLESGPRAAADPGRFMASGNGSAC